MRIHKTLELADDKFYMITCGKAGFQVPFILLSTIGMVEVFKLLYIVMTSLKLANRSVHRINDNLFLL